YCFAESILFEFRYVFGDSVRGEELPLLLLQNAFLPIPNHTILGPNRRGILRHANGIHQSLHFAAKMVLFSFCRTFLLSDILAKAIALHANQIADMVGSGYLVIEFHILFSLGMTF